MSIKKHNVKNLVIGRLISPFDASINTREYDLKELRKHLSNYGYYNIPYWEGKESEPYHPYPGHIRDSKYRKIIVEKTNVGIANRIKAKEILTGEKFDYICRYQKVGKFDTYSFKFNQFNCDPYVYIFESDNPTDEYLIEYLEEHIDVDEYREELQSIKEKSLELRMQSDEVYQQRINKEKTKKQKINDLKDRMFSLPDLIKEYHCSNNATKVILKIVKDESYLVSVPIEELLKRIKDEYKGLNDNEYLSIVGIILRLQSSEEQNKEYIKI